MWKCQRWEMSWRRHRGRWGARFRGVQHGSASALFANYSRIQFSREYSDIYAGYDTIGYAPARMIFTELRVTPRATRRVSAQASVAFAQAFCRAAAVACAFLRATQFMVP